MTAYLRLISNEIAYHRRAAIHFCMNTSIPREWYRTFLAVLQEGSLSGASRTLNITQPTAGRHIAGLEAALGGPYLPARKPACWRPTRRWRCGCTPRRWTTPPGRWNARRLTSVATEPSCVAWCGWPPARWSARRCCRRWLPGSGRRARISSSN
ncbi:LysR family transcriptional regulator [Klebsiella pneumoniae]|nr:LysR family transcriptional regulator [Klebsiella pneumoniae]